MTKCLAIDRNNNDCRCNALNESRFCKNHSYMSDYTDEMMANQTICSGCKKSYYLPDGVKTCSNCKERVKQSKITTREAVVLCASDACKFKRSEENKYCMKHQLCVFVDETAALGKKLCKQYVRGCRAQLDTDYSKSACEECLVIEREKDRSRRGYAQKMTAPEPNKQICTTCCKTLDEEQFIGHNAEHTKTCASCREANRFQDMKRDKEHRNELSRIAEQKPERKAVKQEWNENNYEKVVMKGLNYRQRQIEADVDQYLNKNAENAKQWRDRNPEKVATNNQNRLENVKIHYSNYKRSANDKNLEFGLSSDVFDEIVKAPCYYCGTIQDKGFNGIDRQNSEIGYVVDNCVSCCQMCNYMKASMSVDAFLGRVEHILTYNGRIQGRLFPEMFPDYTSASYVDYNKRASKKNLDFVLSRDEFEALKLHPCYLCGKQSNSQHLNGVDRLDNTKGYSIENVKSCCFGCNHIKRNYVLEDVFKKFMDIYSFNISLKSDMQSDNVVCQTLIEVVEQVEQRIVTDENNTMQSVIDGALAKRREYERTKKARQRLQMKETHGNDEYKKMRALEMANYRKAQNVSNQSQNVNNSEISLLTDMQENNKTDTEYKPTTTELSSAKNTNNKDMVANKNKKTDEEKREAARVRKATQRQRLKDTYGNDEYNRQKAADLAEYRKNKKMETNM